MYSPARIDWKAASVFLILVWCVVLLTESNLLIGLGFTGLFALFDGFLWMLKKLFEEDDMPSTVKVRHVGITVSDTEISLIFHRDLLGLKIHQEMEESGKHIDNFSNLKDVKVKTVKLQCCDGSLLELLEYSSPCEVDCFEERPINFVGCSHFALTVDDLDSLYEKLRINGVSFNYQVQSSPDGNVKLAFCKDPDGTLIELVEEL